MREDVIEMLSDCEKRESKLIEWEQTFIQSLGEQHRPLTDKQYDRLVSIWKRITT